MRTYLAYNEVRRWQPDDQIAEVKLHSSSCSVLTISGLCAQTSEQSRDSTQGHAGGAVLFLVR